ncbi:MAG: hypothetical protein F4114_18145 [Rhodospirillaceae bacterium]|nr:hypothetical protein [Rhodospirillaceae bacterium]MYI50991.1 hypothetical protein [Rhodospirillaceae bacterium]
MIYIFGRGLDGERYAVERYRARPDGQIHPVGAGQPKVKGGGRRPKRTIASAAEVGRFQPGRDEIIVCTALDLKASGLQLWGLRASGLAAVRYAR